MKDFYCKVSAVFAVAMSVLAILALLASPAKAQSTYGSIVGAVTDASGAVIPGASVTLTNIGTNEKRTFETDAAGNYRFVNLLPANYKLEVEKSGFKHLERDSVVVQVGSTVRIDAALEVGAVTETIEVSAQTPLLNTESASLGQVVEGQQVQQMPLNGRNVVNLIAMTPGVIPQGSSMGSASTNQTDHTNITGWGNFQIGGGISGSNAMYVDGAPINVLSQNAIGLVITQDSVQEFNVSTNNSGAEFGRSGGGVVNMATKSGTNSFHGSAYEYLRNNVFNANKWESNRAGKKRPQWNQNQYGANLSGPIIKDKLFFFFSWEGFSNRLAVTATSNMPTQDMRNGWVEANLTTTAATTRLAALGVSSACIGGMVLSGGRTQIPSNCISPTAKWYLDNYYNTPNSDFAKMGYNFFLTPVVGDDHNQYTGRADYNISDKQRLFGRFTYWAITSRNQDRADRILSADASTSPHSHQFVLGDTYAFTPTTILDVRLSYLRTKYDDHPSSLGYDISQVSSGLAPYMSQMTANIVPGLGISNTAMSWFGGQRGGFSNSISNNYVFSASLSKMKGSHSLKFGNEFRLMDKNYSGGKNLSGNWSFNAKTPMTGDYWSDFLLGYPSSVSAGSLQPVTNYNYYQGYYVADTWQVNRKMTLNLGLRWELPGAVAEKQDRLTVLLPYTVDPVLKSYADSKGLPYHGGTLAMVSSDLYADRTSVQVKHNLFAPRVGLAYRITSNTVLRAGYGLSQLPSDMGNNLGGENSVINSAART
jgi:hypothetical protein